MFIIVAIDAEVFPVGAVRGVIVMVAVLMMNGEEMPVFIIELPAAFGAYKSVYFKGLLPVIA